MQNDNLKTIEERVQSAANAQQKIAVLHEIAHEIEDTNLQRAIILSKDALKIARAEALDKETADSLHYLSHFYLNIPHYDDALKHAFEAISIYKKISLVPEHAYLLIILSHVYIALGDVTSALNNALESEKLFIRIKDKRGEAHALKIIGNIYAETGDLTGAIQITEKSLSIFQDLSDEKGRVDLLNNMAIIYSMSDDNQKALTYFRECKQIQEKIGSDIDKARCLQNLGIVFDKMKNYDQANELLRQSLQLNEKSNHLTGKIDVFFHLGLVSTHQNDLDKSLFYLQKALALAHKLKTTPRLVVIHGQLSEIYKRAKNFEKAIHHLELHQHLQDELNEEETDYKFKSLQVIHQVEQSEMEKEIYRLKNQELVAVNDKLLAEIDERKKTEDALRESEQRLRESNATKDKFFSIIAHDLKNPLTSISMVSDILSSPEITVDQFEIKGNIKILKNNVSNLLKLLDNLLQWAQTQTGLIECNPEQLDLKKEIDPIISLMTPLASRKNINLSSQIKGPTPIYADPDMLKTILRNLISNAIKFTKQNGSVTVMSRIKGDQVSVSVLDTGIGISENDQTKLFRIDETYSTKGTAAEKGTGLGLILCQEFVGINEDTIGVDSDIGKGSRFTFTLCQDKESFAARN